MASHSALQLQTAPRPRAIRLACSAHRGSLVPLLLACLFATLLALDVPIDCYWLCSSALLLSLYWGLHGVVHSYRLFLVLMVALMYANFAFYRFVKALEVESGTAFKLHTDRIGNKSAAFFQVKAIPPHNEDRLRRVIGYVNRHSAHTLEPLPVESVTAWDAQPLQYEFLLRYWADPAMAAPFACLVEDDVVVDMDYFADQLADRPFGLAHISHFSGDGDSFEPWSPGVLCARKDAPYGLRWWTQAMRYLSSRRYRRIVPLSLLHMPIPRHVFSWTANRGCSTYRPDCHYIHLLNHMDAALKEASRTEDEETRQLEPTDPQAAPLAITTDR